MRGVCPGPLKPDLRLDEFPIDGAMSEDPWWLYKGIGGIHITLSLLLL